MMLVLASVILLTGGQVPAPITHDGVRFELRAETPGVLFAIDEKTQKVAWKVKVHDVALTSLALSSDGQTVSLEAGGIGFAVDVKQRESRIARWPLRLEAGTVTVGPNGWAYQVTVVVENTLRRTLQFDAVSLGQTGELMNALFAVTADGKDVEYRGMMAKRAPPDSFVKVKAGQTLKVRVDLSEYYPVGPDVREVTVRFEHANHFSPDRFVMRSEPLTLRR